jgi:hypothetical protein
MNKTKYIVSVNARDIVVGLLDKDTAEEDINLAHNLFNSHVNYNYYHGVINFNTNGKFLRYLINKYFLMFWEPNKTFRQILKKATNKARDILNTEVEYRNFMPEIYQRQISQIHRYQVRLGE